MPEPLILPDSRTRTIHTPRNSINMGAAAFWQPIFCASCGIKGGNVPEENMSFAFWLCQECFDKHGHITTMYAMPDEVFFQKVIDAQIAKYGRVLTAAETQASLGDPESLESQLARDRSSLTPRSGG